MKLDVLAVCAHPDDAELHCGGLLLRAAAQGAAVGVLDLTRGEAASRGTPETREREAGAASRILGLAVRDNLGLPDTRLDVDHERVTAIIQRLRTWRPRLVVTSHWADHHPDHQSCADLVRRACYLSGIANHAAPGAAHRPEQVLYYLDRIGHRPDLVLDVSDVFERKLAAVRCFASQLHTPDPDRRLPPTPLASAEYLDTWQAGHRYFGGLIGVRYGEGYVLRSPVPLRDPLALLWGRQGIV